MSEQRFDYHKDYDCIIDTKTDIGYSHNSLEALANLLNRQDFAIEVKQKYIEKLEKQLEKIPKSIREVWLE